MMKNQDIAGLVILVGPLVIGLLAFFSPTYGLAVIGVILLYLGVFALLSSIVALPAFGLGAIIAGLAQPAILIVGGILACGIAGGIAAAARRQRYRDN